MRCQECGNKAKKDCLYYRCRSCCKGRGFECETHVKSTWAPVSSTKHHVSANYSTYLPHHHQKEEQQHDQQLHLPSSSSSGEGHFPTEMTGETTFTCVRVTSTSEEHALIDQYAYETSINIGGHVFKGILYDQGPSYPTMKFQDRNVDGGDQKNSTINIQSDLQPLDEPRPSSPPDFSFDIYPHIK